MKKKRTGEVAVKSGNTNASGSHASPPPIDPEPTKLLLLQAGSTINYKCDPVANAKHETSSLLSSSTVALATNRIVGYEIIYPTNCKEVNESLGVNELESRLKEIYSALENFQQSPVDPHLEEKQPQQQQKQTNSKSTDEHKNGQKNNSLLEETSDSLAVASAAAPLQVHQLKGLAFHLTSEQFVEHASLDVRLYVAASLCNILKVFCPQNPFHDNEEADRIMYRLLSFLIGCLLDASNKIRLSSLSDSNHHSNNHNHTDNNKNKQQKKKQKENEEAELEKARSTQRAALFRSILTNICRLDIFVCCKFVTNGHELVDTLFAGVFEMLKHRHNWSWMSDEKLINMFVEMLSNVISNSGGMSGCAVRGGVAAANENAAVADQSLTSVTGVAKTNRGDTEERPQLGGGVEESCGNIGSIITQHTVRRHLLEYLIDPNKTLLPLHNQIAKQIIFRNTDHLEYFIHMILQEFLMKKRFSSNKMRLFDQRIKEEEDEDDNKAYQQEQEVPSDMNKEDLGENEPFDDNEKDFLEQPNLEDEQEKNQPDHQETNDGDVFVKESGKEQRENATAQEKIDEKQPENKAEEREAEGADKEENQEKPDVESLAVSERVLANGRRKRQSMINFEMVYSSKHTSPPSKKQKENAATASDGTLNNNTTTAATTGETVNKNAASDNYELLPTKKSENKTTDVIGDQTFQLLFEIFKINESLVLPILPSLEFKLRSEQVTDRKRACRLLGRLFEISSAPPNAFSTNNSTNSSLSDSVAATASAGNTGVTSGGGNSSSSMISSNLLMLWDAFLGRFQDVSVEVRGIWVAVASRLLIPRIDAGGRVYFTSSTTSNVTSKQPLLNLTQTQELWTRLQERGYDTDETIRMQVMQLVSDWLCLHHVAGEVSAFSSSLASCATTTPSSSSLHTQLETMLLNRTRDTSLKIRKQVHLSLAKLYQKRSIGAIHRSVIKPQKDQMQNQEENKFINRAASGVMRLALAISVEDRICAERLYKTHLVPYNMSVAERAFKLVQLWHALDTLGKRGFQEMLRVQTFLLRNLRNISLVFCNDASAMKPLFATAVDAKNTEEESGGKKSELAGEPTEKLGPGRKKRVTADDMNEATKEQVDTIIQRIIEYLPHHDRNLFTIKLFVRFLRQSNAARNLILKFSEPSKSSEASSTLIEIIKRFSEQAGNVGSGSSARDATILQDSNVKEQVVRIVKCLLERAAPVIIDVELVQHHLPHLKKHQPKSIHNSSSTPTAIKKSATAAKNNRKRKKRNDNNDSEGENDAEDEEETIVPEANVDDENSKEMEQLRSNLFLVQVISQNASHFIPINSLLKVIVPLIVEPLSSKEKHKLEQGDKDKDHRLLAIEILIRNFEENIFCSSSGTIGSAAAPTDPNKDFTPALNSTSNTSTPRSSSSKLMATPNNFPHLDFLIERNSKSTAVSSSAATTTTTVTESSLLMMSSGGGSVAGGATLSKLTQLSDRKSDQTLIKEWIEIGDFIPQLISLLKKWSLYADVDANEDGDATPATSQLNLALAKAAIRCFTTLLTVGYCAYSKLLANKLLCVRDHTNWQMIEKFLQQVYDCVQDVFNECIQCPQEDKFHCLQLYTLSQISRFLGSLYHTKLTQYICEHQILRMFQWIEKHRLSARDNTSSSISTNQKAQKQQQQTSVLPLLWKADTTTAAMSNELQCVLFAIKLLSNFIYGASQTSLVYLNSKKILYETENLLYSIYKIVDSPTSKFSNSQIPEKQDSALSAASAPGSATNHKRGPRKKAVDKEVAKSVTRNTGGGGGGGDGGCVIEEWEKSRVRLQVGKAWLKMNQRRLVLQNTRLRWFLHWAQLACDPCAEVRDAFVRRLHNQLSRMLLPIEYVSVFAFAADSDAMRLADNSKELSEYAHQRVAGFLLANIKLRNLYIERSAPQLLLTNPKIMWSVLPEFILPFVIHNLARCPSWRRFYAAENVNRVRSALWMVLEPLLACRANPSNNNIALLRNILEKIRRSKDAVFPNSAPINRRIYFCCDVALCLILVKSKPAMLLLQPNNKDYLTDPNLPSNRYVTVSRSLQAEQQETEKEEDAMVAEFSTLYEEKSGAPLIQFAAIKQSRAVQDGFISADLVKGSSPAAVAMGGTATAKYSTAIHLCDSRYDYSGKWWCQSAPPHPATAVVTTAASSSTSATDNKAKTSKETDVTSSQQTAASSVDASNKATEREMEEKPGKTERPSTALTLKKTAVNRGRGRKKQEKNDDITAVVAEKLVGEVVGDDVTAALQESKPINSRGRPVRSASRMAYATIISLRDIRAPGFAVSSNKAAAPSEPANHSAEMTSQPIIGPIGISTNSNSENGERQDEEKAKNKTKPHNQNNKKIEKESSTKICSQMTIFLDDVMNDVSRVGTIRPENTNGDKNATDAQLAEEAETELDAARESIGEAAQHNEKPKRAAQRMKRKRQVNKDEVGDDDSARQSRNDSEAIISSKGADDDEKDTTAPPCEENQALSRLRSKRNASKSATIDLFKAVAVSPKRRKK